MAVAKRAFRLSIPFRLSKYGISAGLVTPAESKFRDWIIVLNRNPRNWRSRSV